MTTIIGANQTNDRYLHLESRFGITLCLWYLFIHLPWYFHSMEWQATLETGRTRDIDGYKYH